jgi:hypothetical protein
MELETFRRMVRRYRQLAGCSQAALARDVGVHPCVLSRKLNGTGAYLTAPEVKQLIRTLAGRGALTSRMQVYDLLAAAAIGRHAFTAGDWCTPPLSQLTSGGWATDAADADVAAVRALLRRPGVRVVTLVGGHDTGTTRVALRVAERERSCFPGGVSVLPRLAGSAAIGRALRGGAALLVLDGLDRMTSAAGELVAALAGSPGSKALITSRTTLGLSGGRELHLS